MNAKGARELWTEQNDVESKGFLEGFDAAERILVRTLEYLDKYYEEWPETKIRPDLRVKEALDEWQKVRGE